MKKFILISGIIFSGFPLWAQPGGTSSSDPAAKKILDAVSAKFKTYKAVKATFSLIAEDIQGKVQGNKKGTIFMKGSKYRVSITGQEIFSDGSTIWTHDKAANEVTITQLDASSGSITPQKLFTNFYDKDFLYKLNGEKKQGNKVLQEIEMTPTDKSRNFHKVYIWVDKASQTIMTTRILEKSGNRYVYSVTSFSGNATVPDATFIFDKKQFPGVEVIDLR
jgi:outer membrane lipoprotein carrier protein